MSSFCQTARARKVRTFSLVCSIDSVFMYYYIFTCMCLTQGSWLNSRTPGYAKSGKKRKATEDGKSC